MAREDYSGVPDVSARQDVGDDYQHIQASPDAFGAQLGQGVEALGQGVNKAADFFGTIQTDDATNQAMGATSKLADQFETLQGADALHARAGINQSIDDTIEAARNGLSGALQQKQFDMSMRTYRNRFLDSRISSHADEQAKSYAMGVSSDTLNNSLQQVAATPDNDQVVNAARNSARSALVRHAQIMFGDSADPSVFHNAAMQADQAVIKTQAQALAVKDPTAALSLLDNNRALVGVDYAPLADSFRARAVQQQAPGIANSIISQTYGKGIPQLPGATPDTATATGAHPAIYAAFGSQESGNDPNAPTSINGAIGARQITPATFQEFSKPGENITNPADNAAVGNRMLDKYMSDYHGDVSRVAVAYFSGPGNVAPAGSLTPWISNKQDGNGQTVSGYVQGINSKVMKANLDMGKASAFATVDQQYGDNPQMAQEVKQQITQRYAEVTLAQQAQQIQQQQTSNEARDEYVKQFIGGQVGPDTIAKIGNDPRLQASDRENLYDFAQRVQGSKLNGDAAQYGAGFWPAYQRITAPAGDPNRISDMSTILQMAGPQGSVSLAGVEKLSEILTTNQRSVNDQAVNTSKASLINYAKGKLSFEDESLGAMGPKDPKGMAIFNSQFIPKFEAGYDQWVKDGKDPWQYLTQDTVDKMVTGMRSKREMSLDKLTADNGLPPGTPVEDPNAPLPAAPKDIDQAAWTQLVSKPPPTANGGSMTHAAWGQALGMLLKDPSPETIKAFNASKFGKAGYDAQQLLNQLHTKPANADDSSLTLGNALD